MHMSAGYFSGNYSVQLKDLVRLIVRMKLYTSKILNHSEHLLKNYDVEERLKEEKLKIFEAEKKLRSASIELEDSVNKIIALSQPLAFDLRFILSSLKISSELRYIANWVKKSVKAIERMATSSLLETSRNELIQMINISFNRLKGVITILLQFDNKKKSASEILPILDKMMNDDDIVDEIYRKILQNGLSSVKENQSDAIFVFEIIGIAKNLEKVSDGINNIISTTRYVLTGKRIQ